jgi:glycosyltransferase involved in cell wall biosynthesis
MNILFDGRALQSGITSGVPRVAGWLLRELSSKSEHRVTVFTTGWSRVRVPALDGLSVRHVHLRIPNKLLHLSLFLLGAPKLDRLVSRQTGEAYDAVFLPNLHFFSASAPHALLVHDLSFLVLPSFFSRFERFVHTLKRPLRLMQRATWLFAVSESTRWDVMRFTLREDSYVIDISACETGTDSPAPFSGERRDIIFISTTEPRKNLESAIAGFLAWENPEHHRLLIIGAITRNGRDIQRQFRGAKNVIWLGAIGDATRSTLLARAKALLYPSKFEGFGLPLVEAQRFGTPIITSQVTSMPEVAPSAVLIDPHRPDTITAALDCIAPQPEPERVHVPPADVILQTLTQEKTPRS